MARLQEELIGVKLREAEALTGLKELRQQVRDLEEHWQVSSTYTFNQYIILIMKKATDLQLSSASPGTHSRSLEGEPQEEHAE